MLLFTYVGNKEETKDRCKDSKDNLNYGQDICSEGNDQVWTGTVINIPRGSEGVDVTANDFQTQCSGDDRKGNKGKNLKLKQTNRDTLKVTSKELKSSLVRKATSLRRTSEVLIGGVIPSECNCQTRTVMIYSVTKNVL